ncbi:hypothetical protein JR316_0007842 [Psilocybe cubensis]|uniref:Uncharacterized protein n=2 Tax=Psilocybe cubensis TaxID=181762 RepID=A0A8H7XSL7_PSICU|nr:hypothetical protein JR316_0007842 [Psilocybe cubensis]KAH9479254.1 hypothetical protein JR316_0007842 [Psilocybe cubensis]
MPASCCHSASSVSSATPAASSSSSSSPYARTTVLNAMSIDFPQQPPPPPPHPAPARTQSAKIARPRGLWKARGTLASKLGHASDYSTPPTPPTTSFPGKRYSHPDPHPDAHSDRWLSPDPFSECEYDSDSSGASLSLHQQHLDLYHDGHTFLRDPPTLSKRRRRDTDSPPTSLDERDTEEVIYWDYSRKCTPNLDIEKDWTRSKLMDTSPITMSSMAPATPGAMEAAAAAQRATTDLEDWEDLKELFAKAAEMYESQSPSETLPLLRGVIHECHRFLQMYHDPSVIYTSPPSNNGTPPAVDKKIINDWLLAERLHAQHQAKSQSVATDASTVAPSTTTTTTTAEKKCKCKDLPTAFYTILGTTLFFFGNIVDASPSLCMPGEPANPVVYWLCALDAFEIGENLPARTSGRVNNVKGDYFSSGGSTGVVSRSAYAARAAGVTPPPEDWRMAVVWGRTLVCIAEEVVRRQHERSKQGLPPLSHTSPQLGFALAPGMQLSNYADVVPLAPTMPASPSAFPLPQQRLAEAQKDAAAAGSNLDSPVWPPNSPFATIISRRPALPPRLTLDSGVSPHELLLLAQDQFSRGILHMPHPQHLVHTRLPRVDHTNSTVPDSFLFTPALGPSTTYDKKNARSASSISTVSSQQTASTSTSPPTTTTSSSSVSISPPAHSPAASTETFSRAKELYTIAYEVLLLAEKLDSASERQTWAQWADSVFSQMKMEADTDAWRGHITAARGRCCVVIGSALAEGVEERLEKAGGGVDDDMTGGGGGKRKREDESGVPRETEEQVLASEEAREAREVLSEAIGYLERAKEVFEARMQEEKEQAARGGAASAQQAQDEEEEEEDEEGMIVIEDADEEDESEDSDEIVADDSSATPTPATTRGAAVSSPISHLRMPGSRSLGKVTAATQTVSEEDASKTASTLPSSSSTSKSASASSSSALSPPASSNPNPSSGNTAEDEVEELKTLLAEALLSLANLTVDGAERERLYARAQVEGGDKFELDEWDEEDRMDED